METLTAPKRAPVDWQSIREAFVTRCPTPTYTELSAEFAVSLSGVSRMANEENWADIRQRRIEQTMKENGASEIILAAIQSEGELTKRGRQFIIDFIGTGEALRQALAEDEGKPSSRISSLNNLGFAFANIGRFVESIASLSLSGKLTRAQKAGTEGDGAGWQKGMLQQINVTVKNIQAEAGKLSAAEKAEPVSVDPAGPAGGF